jgi:hypothetical protein
MKGLKLVNTKKLYSLSKRISNWKKANKIRKEVLENYV